jgi:hypothetical protein
MLTPNKANYLEINESAGHEKVLLITNKLFPL